MAESEGSEDTSDTELRRSSDSRKRNPKTSQLQTNRPAQLKPYRIIFDDWQNKFIQTIGDKILCCGRQVGKTESCAADAAEWAVNKNNGFPVVMVAPTERQSSALFQKTLNYLLAVYPKYVITKGLKRPTKERITLTNGIEIYCLPVGQSGTGIRFVTIGRLYVDEASRVPEDVWEAIIPALLTTGGDTILLSTPFGKQGMFYKTWINEDDAYKSFTRFSVTSETVMRERPLSESWTELRRDRSLLKLEQAKVRFSTKRYAQEFLGEFIEDLFNFYNKEIIENSCILKRPTENIQDQSRFYLGVDIARMGNDCSAFCILKKYNGRKIELVECFRTKKTKTTDTYQMILELDRRFNFKQIGIDAGSGTLGVGVLDFLLRSPVKNKVIPLNNQARDMDSRGERKKTMMKVDMHINLLSMLQQGMLKLLDDPDLLASLNSVQYEYVATAGQDTRMVIFSPNHEDSDIVEALMRAAWLANTKGLNSFIDYI